MKGELEDLLVGAIEKFRAQPPILYPRCGSIAVLGDTHGYDHVTRWFVGEFGGRVDCLFILGDLVDRGPRSLENLVAALKFFLERDDLYIIRGNHESVLMNRWYGFLDELALKLGGEEYRDILSLVSTLYTEMPYAAVAQDIFLVHGGIPCRRCLNKPEPPFTLEELGQRLRGVKGRKEAAVPSDSVAMQLLWNDPDPGLEWFSPNIRGPGTFYYGIEAWRSFLRENDLGLIIRAHEKVNGALIYTGSGGQINPLRYKTPLRVERLRGSVVTVFSSLYHGMEGAAVVVDKGFLHAYEVPR